MTTAREHFLWAHDRAMEYIELGDGPNALSSLISDLGKHEGTRDIVSPDMIGLAFGPSMIITAKAARRFIEGLPVPPDNPNPTSQED